MNSSRPVETAGVHHVWGGPLKCPCRLGAAHVCQAQFPELALESTEPRSFLKNRQTACGADPPGLGTADNALSPGR